MLQKDHEYSSIERKCLWMVDIRKWMSADEMRGCKKLWGPVWSWREDLSQFAMMENRLRAHNTSCLAASDQGDQREHWIWQLRSGWAV